MENEKKFQDFLLALKILSNKYGVHIGGCGCCGSPWLEEIKVRGEYRHNGEFENLFWIEEDPSKEKGK